MTKLYTLDRMGLLSANQLIDLNNDFKDLPLIEIQDLISKDDLISRVNALYPTGISKHGENYLLGRIIVNDNRGAPTHFVHTEPMAEIIFELVRKAEFPTLPSRMQCLYCWQNLEDLQRFCNDHSLNYDSSLRIYEIDADDFFVGDMRLLYLGGQVLNALEFARMYWSGERSSNPHLEVLVPLPVQLGSRVEI